MLEKNPKKERIAIINGLRTPMAKAGGKFSNIQADELGAILFRELMMQSSVTMDEVDEVIIGNVAQPIHASNIARVIALRAGFDEKTPALTVHRNCASGATPLSSQEPLLMEVSLQVYALTHRPSHQHWVK